MSLFLRTRSRLNKCHIFCFEQIQNKNHIRGDGYSSQSQYVNEIRKFWEKDPNSVHPYWDSHFKSKHLKGTSNEIIATNRRETRVHSEEHTRMAPSESIECERMASVEDSILVNDLIKSYQEKGHYKARLDPLNNTLGPVIKNRTVDHQIFREHELPKDTATSYCLPDSTFIGYGQRSLHFQELIKRLEYSYCNSIGVESIHLTSPDKRDFIRRSMEVEKVPPPLSKEQRVHLLTDLIKSGEFEAFLAKKWPSEKRFGLEGNDSFIPGINHIIECASDLGANAFVLGMAHRGRLNTLTNVLKTSPKHIFARFQPVEISDQHGIGDVKYHLGTSNVINTPFSKKSVRISLISNPSHLESVNTIVLGKARAEQIFYEKGDKSKVWPIVIHGDAAIAGQGVVYEGIHLGGLESFAYGGAIHIVINNQIGFTTDPQYSSSSEYPTSVLRMIEAPIFHVNGDDLEAVAFCCRMAAEFRAAFQTDVGINIVGYRRNGHNEADEPRFTQPLLYKKIDNMKHVQNIYAEQLISEKIVTKEEVDKIRKDYEQELELNFVEASKETGINQTLWIDSPWKGFFKGKDPLMVPSTGVSQDVLNKLSEVISVPPPSITMHRALIRIFKNRAKSLEKGVVDWSCGESFAYGTLLQEGVYVRLSGQDVERGTFSHRHHILHDQTPFSYKKVNLLANVFPGQATYSISDSSLSEYGVMGFELGMSMVSPNALIMWEAQFGDFCNSAQIIIDQYLSSGEAKWTRQSAITLLLPHGMEGMGPEHSSARMERFLQLCNDDEAVLEWNMPLQMKTANWFLAVPSTPASFFHVIRRQVKLNYRKPLVLFTPKALLRLPACVSQISEFTVGTKFKPYLPDPEVAASPNIKKLLLCSGKVYYELREERTNRNLQDKIAIGRIEQLFPLPYSDIVEDAAKYTTALVCWVQEEHKNQGAWSYMAPRLNKALGISKGPVIYIGRPPSCAAATGLKTIHERERSQFLDEAMEV